MENLQIFHGLKMCMHKIISNHIGTVYIFHHFPKVTQTQHELKSEANKLQEEVT